MLARTVLFEEAVRLAWKSRNEELAAGCRKKTDA